MHTGQGVSEPLALGPFQLSHSGPSPAVTRACPGRPVLLGHAERRVCAFPAGDFNPELGLSGHTLGTELWSSSSGLLHCPPPPAVLLHQVTVLPSSNSPGCGRRKPGKETTSQPPTCTPAVGAALPGPCPLGGHHWEVDQLHHCTTARSRTATPQRMLPSEKPEGVLTIMSSCEVSTVLITDTYNQRQAALNNCSDRSKFSVGGHPTEGSEASEAVLSPEQRAGRAPRRGQRGSAASGEGNRAGTRPASRPGSPGGGAPGRPPGPAAFQCGVGTHRQGQHPARAARVPTPPGAGPGPGSQPSVREAGR